MRTPRCTCCRHLCLVRAVATAGWLAAAAAAAAVPCVLVCGGLMCACVRLLCAGALKPKSSPGSCPRRRGCEPGCWLPAKTTRHAALLHVLCTRSCYVHSLTHANTPPEPSCWRDFGGRSWPCHPPYCQRRKQCWRCRHCAKTAHLPCGGGWPAAWLIPFAHRGSPGTSRRRLVPGGCLHGHTRTRTRTRTRTNKMHQWAVCGWVAVPVAIGTHGSATYTCPVCRPRGTCAQSQLQRSWRRRTTPPACSS